jgi:two-component system, OmpR family, phosphate regulon sensor histidine kinase PhoR
MSLLILLCGVAIGWLISYLNQREINFQLKDILDSLSDYQGKRAELSIASLVRREVLYLKEKNKSLLRESQSWQDLLLKAPVGYLQVDSKNNLIWCNEYARKTLSIDRWQNGQVRLLLELVRSSELDQLIEKTRALNESLNLSWVFYPIYYTANDQKISLEATSYVLENGDVGVFLENQQTLSQERKNWERSMSDLMHELRTPLTSISLLSENLFERLQGQDKKWSGLILSQTSRLMTLVGTWLDLSQFYEAPSLNYQEVELHDLLESTWQQLGPGASRSRITFSYTGPEQIYIKADKDRLIQVFTNLFDNAIKHSAPDGNIDVQVTSSAKTIGIDVLDQGDGFSQEDIPYVFERFYRGSHNKSDQGNGLGLSIVEKIVHAHQGTISAQNHPTTGGALLKIILPREPN